MTTGAIRRAKLQSNHHQQTNSQLFTGWMSFLSPNQQCQITEGKTARNSICLLNFILLHEHQHRVPTLLLTKNPGLSGTFQAPMKNFPGPFRSPRMFKYKEKTAFIYNIQSVVHCRKFSMKQNVLHCCCLFSIEPLEKCTTFKDIFPGLSRILSFNFQVFPGPK